MTKIDRIKLDMRESHEILAFYKKLQPYFEINLALDTDGDDKPSNYHTSSRLEALNFVYYNFIQEVIKVCNAIPEENYCYCAECNPIEASPVEGAAYELDYKELFKEALANYKIPPRECKNCGLNNKMSMMLKSPEEQQAYLCGDHKDYFKPLDIES